MHFSTQQQNAIDARGASILLSAAAGSGKTTVMIQRIITMLSQGLCRADELLVLTFTRAASANMRTKLENALASALGENPDDPLLLRAAADLPCAQISTFDSFCTTLVQRYFYLTPMHADARMLDDNELALLEQDVMDSVLEEAAGEFERGEFPELELLYDCFSSGKKDDSLAAAVLQLYNHCQLYPDPEARLCELCSPASDAPFRASDLELLKKRCVAGLGTLEHFAQLSALVPGKDGARLLALNAQDRALYNAILEAEDISAVSGLKFSAFARIAPCAEKETLKRLRDVIKDTADIKACGEKCAPEELERLSTLLCGLMRLVCRYQECLQQECVARNVMSFALAQRLAVELTALPEVLRELHGDYRYIFVDEDQDSNRLQRYMVSRLANSDESNLFMVGDVKQSIYRFRNAEPALFLDKMQQYASGDGERHRVMYLNTNYRSHKNILDCVNLIFRRNMHADFFELDYDSNEELHAPEGECWQNDPEYMHKSCVSLITSGERLTQRERDTAEARNAVRLCKSLLGTPIGPDRRPARYGDIALLHRSANKKSAVFAQEFARAGIPFSAAGEDSPLESYEVCCVLDLLRVIDNRRDDYALFSAMRLYGFSFDKLISLRCADRKSSFCDCIINSSDSDVTAFLSELERLSFMCACRPLWQVIWEIYDSTGFFARCAALDNGAARTENLRYLADMAEKYCSGDGVTLRGFLSLCEENGGRDSADARISGDRVHMLTVHKSKGLEFPIVIVAGCGEPLFPRQSPSRLRISRELGVTVRTEKGAPSFGSALVASAERRERFYGLSEQLRGLYVAATRAVDKLVFSGIYAPHSYDEDAVRFNASCYFDFLLPAVFAHPDGMALADSLGLLMPPGEALGRWECETVSAESLAAPPAAKAAPAEFDGTPEEIEHALKSLTFRYAYPEAAAMPGKASASQTAKSYELAPPDLTGGITAAALGSAYHLLLEHTDFCEPAAVTRDRLIKNGLLDAQTAKRLRLYKLDRLIASELGHTLAGKELHRETPFTMLKEKDGEKYIVQGIIDCFYVRNGKAVLLDFKSDRVRLTEGAEERDAPLTENEQGAGGSSCEEIALRYRPQLELYREALKKCFGLECESGSLYLLDINRELRLF